MDAKEWNAYVDYASSGEWPIPRGFISDYDNWICRSVVGRALFFRDKVEEAMAVLATVVDVVPSMEKPAAGMGEVEHKILCLRDLAKIVWGLSGNIEAALRFWDEAMELCEKWPYGFNSVARGSIAYERLVMLLAAGREEEVENTLKAMVASEHFEQENINSYRYYAYKFMAEREYGAQNYQKAALLYEKAFGYYPKSAAGLKDEIAAKAIADPKERYAQFKAMSSMQYLHWDFVPEAIIKRD